MKVTRVSLGAEVVGVEAWEEVEEEVVEEIWGAIPNPTHRTPVSSRVVEGGAADPEDSGGGHFRRRHGAFRRLASTRGIATPTRRKDGREDGKGRAKDEEVKSGWVRVFPEAAGGGGEGRPRDPWDGEVVSEGEGEQLGTLVHLTPSATAADICRDLHLPDCYTVWVQYGGGTSRRLTATENPLLIQDGFLRQLGYCEMSRRSRLGIDPELRHLIRFHVGPSVPIPTLEGITRCGTVLVLKGHAFPQWKPRPVAILGTTLFIFPPQDAGSGVEGETLDLSGGHVVGGVSKGGRIMLRVAPTPSSPQRPVFLGFDEPRDRRVWWKWLAGATDNSPQQDPESDDCGPEATRSLPSSSEDDARPEVLDLSRGHLDGRLPSARLLLRAAAPPLQSIPDSPVLQPAGGRGDAGGGGGSGKGSGGPKAIDLSGNRLGCIGVPQDGGSPADEEVTPEEEAPEGGEGRKPNSRGRADGSGATLSSPAHPEVSGGSLLVVRPGDGVCVGGLSIGSEEPSEEEEDLRVLLSGVRSLRLSGNGLSSVPKALLRLLRGAGGPPPSPPPTPRRYYHHPRGRRQGLAQQKARTAVGGATVPLVRLDLSDNLLEELPEDIGKLHSLPEDADFRGEGAEEGEEEEGVEEVDVKRKSGVRRRCWEETKRPEDHEVSQLSPSLLEKIDLRNNLLDGDVVLGNYENLRELDLSDNDIERLDVRALRHLSVVQCARNSLVHLSLPGHKLTTLIASHNRLVSLMVEPTPLNLEHLHVSRNDLQSLPDWPWERFRHLNFLDASHNHLETLPHRLHVAPNLTELHLHANKINCLHEGFLSSPSLQVINLSNNKLTGGLPPLVLGSDGLLPWSSPLLSLRLTGNNLTDAIWEALSELTALTVLHLAYNSLTTVPEKCVEMWTDLEELVVSGNTLSILPDSIGQLKKLRALRAHSNKLQQPPKGLSKLNSLRVLDLSHNQLERVNLGDLVPQRLSFLDLSGNPRLHVDPSQFNSYRSQRRMSLVDVSGNNRTSLPSTPYHEAGESYQTIDEGNEERSHIGPPWKVGFSETPGNLDRLYTTQIRLPAFCNTEGLFGLFDGGSVKEGNEGGAETASLLASVVPRILLEERTVKETATDYMKYTLLSAHRELKEKGQKFGACAILCHVTAKSASCNTVSKAGSNNTVTNGDVPHQQYILRVASVGRVGAVLCRKDGSIFPLTAPFRSLEDDLGNENEQDEKKYPSKNENHDQHALGMSASFPQVVPDPHVAEVDLTSERDLCIIIANKIFWSSVQQNEAACEAQVMLKPNSGGIDEMLAAKRLQDLAQGYGNTGNLSIAVVHLFGSQDKKSDKDVTQDALRKSLRIIQRNGTTDLLMKELKEELRSHHPCIRHCCCHCTWANEGEREECHLCLPHVCHRRWCTGMPEERAGCTTENGMKSVSVSNGINHFKVQSESKVKSIECKSNQQNENCGGSKESFQECSQKKIHMASEICIDEHEVPSKNLPERSSPSGQSDDAPSTVVKDKNDLEEKSSQDNSDSGFSRCTMKENFWEEQARNGEVSKLRRIPGAWDVCVGTESVLMREKGLHKVSAMPALVMSDDYSVIGGREKSPSEEGSQVGGVDERFKCWEYMLEQNTQLLFDKELDTLSRGIVRGRSRAPWTEGFPSNGTTSGTVNGSGPPQYRPPPPPAPFLSRRFSSARGTGKGGRGWGKSSISSGTKWGGSGRGHAPVEVASPPIQGGPNAAYFGSLQRLLPGHVGFDFEAVREKHRSGSDVRGDSMNETERSWDKDNESTNGETENRMQAYWGVATTEL
ncbi:PH domain leucine-rich repeat protein phosphatase 1 [Hetaerina americana]|uniref:PH domain leucine-rich repeat protein phosphatase 1 n=1 Tax=Hetaerina americana TaxID=62018 RepID=UPI003A7F45BE